VQKKVDPENRCSCYSKNPAIIVSQLSVILHLPYGRHLERRYQRREPVARRGTVVDAHGIAETNSGLALSIGISEA